MDGYDAPLLLRRGALRSSSYLLNWSRTGDSVSFLDPEAGEGPQGRFVEQRARDRP